MTPKTVTLFFALLALASLASVAVALVLSVLRRRVPAAAVLSDRLLTELRRPAVALAAGVAVVATLGSLYLSEVAGYPPCGLCWVQRGFMYPLALLLVGAAWRGWRPVVPWARAWAILGGAVSAWHIGVERLPGLAQSAVCDAANPCTIRWVEHLGFITIPVMALAAFALIVVLLGIRPEPDADDNDDAHLSSRHTTRPSREQIP